MRVMAKLPEKLFTAKTPAELFDLLVPHLGHKPTAKELSAWTHTVLGPYHIPTEVFARCAPKE